MDGPAAIDGYIRDPGAGNYFVGHRRWILHPGQKVMGVGSTSSSNALWVFGTFVKRPKKPEFVAWPPVGFVPDKFGLKKGYRWSLSMHRADFSGARVRMSQGGRSIRLSQAALKKGFADNTLVWTPRNLPQMRSGRDLPIDVEVRNVGVGARKRTIRYRVTFIDPARSGDVVEPAKPTPGKVDKVWVSLKGDLLSGKAFGIESAGGHIYLCRGHNFGAFYVGEVGKGGCRVSFNKRPFKISRFEVLVRGQYRWRKFRGSLPAGALKVGTHGTRSVYACKTRVGGDPRLGGVQGSRCHVVLGNLVLRLRKFEVLIK